MKKKVNKKIDVDSENREPEWMNPANDRKTPYTEEELAEFAEGFISNMGDTEKLRNMMEKEGIDKVKALIIESFRKQDERNLINMDIKGPIN